MEGLELNYPQELPVSEHRQEILSALRSNPVVIVCGDTGSGKTTQLPKMAMEERMGDGERRTGNRRIAVTRSAMVTAASLRGCVTAIRL